MLTIEKFRRITTGKVVLEEVDGLRCLAILYVIIAHLHGFFVQKTPYFKSEINSSVLLDFVGSIGRDGKHGVAIFFVISGFILALPFAKFYLNISKNKLSLKGYFIRRLTRLEPPYIIALIILSLVIIAKNIFTASELFPHFLGSLFYVHNIIFNTMSWIIPVAWSLEVEVQFYILAPFLSLLFAFKKFSVRLVLICLGIVISAFLQETALFKSSFSLQMSLLGWFQYFMIGFLLADIYLTQKVGLHLPKIIQFLLGFFVLVGLSFMPYEGAFVQRITYAFLCFLFFLMVLHFPVWKGIFSLRYISIIGGMCYSIYLLHFATISFIGNYTIHLKITDSLAINYLLQWFVILLAILAVSGFYFLLIEKPCMRKDWPERLIKKIKGKSPDENLNETSTTVAKSLTSTKT